jgi:dynein heavy chain
MASPMPETQMLPNFGQTEVKLFTKALIVRCLRPDRTIFGAKIYIAESLGKLENDQTYNDYPKVSLDSIAAEAGNRSPVIFLLSAGSDPTPLIEEAAKRVKKELNTVSMGQGREEFAENFISHSKANGEWVLLQNCHLGLRYMETLFEM